MDIWKSMVLGLLQGVLEFLPVSSSGHVFLAQQLLQVQISEPILFAAALHLGSALAILIAFAKDTLRVLLEGVSLLGDCLYNAGLTIQNIGRKEKKRYRRLLFTSGRRLTSLLLVSTLFTCVIGFLLQDIVADGSNFVPLIGAGFLVNGLMLLRADPAEWGTKRTGETTYLDAAVIGTGQGLSVLPGISRLGLTVTLGMYCGLEKGYAVRYSFLASFPAFLGAAVVGMIRAGGIPAELFPALFAGFLMSFLAGTLTIKGLLHWIVSRRFWPFGVYSILVGVVALALWLVL